MATETTKREVSGHETIHFRMRPASFTVRFYVRGASRLVDAIRAIPEGLSARHYLIGVDTDAVIPDPSGDWGEIILTVRATDERLAERTAQKILEAAKVD